MRGHWTKEDFEGPPPALDDGWWLVPWPMKAFSLGTQLQLGEGDSNLEAPHRVRRQRSAQVSQSLSEPVALEIRHPQTPLARTLIANLPTNQRASTFPKKLEKGLYQRRPMILRQRMYGQTVKDQGEDVHGTHLRPALQGQLPSKPGTHLRFYLGPYFQPITLQLEAGPEPHPENADGAVTPAGGPW